MRYSPFILTAVLLAGCGASEIIILPLEVESVPILREASEDGVTCLLQGEYPRVSSVSEKHHTEAVNAAIQEEMSVQYIEDIKNCPQRYLDLIEPGSTITEESHFGYQVELNQNSLLSITHFASHNLEGAAHPTNVLNALTLDTTTGESITLSSLFAEGAPYRNLLTAFVDAQMERDGVDPTSRKEFDEWIFYLRPRHLVLGNFFDIHALQGMQIAISLAELESVAQEDGPLMRLLKAGSST